MIAYFKTKEELLENIHDDIKEIENIKRLYKYKLKVFKKYLIKINERIQKEDDADKIKLYIDILHIIQDNLKYCRRQTKESRKLLILLSDIENNINQTDKWNLIKKIKQYNPNYNILKNDLIENSIKQEQLKIKYIDKFAFEELLNDNDLNCNSENNKENRKIEEDKEKEINDGKQTVENMLQDNDTLLISEVKNKIIFPYKISEIKEMLKNEEQNYSNITKVIEEKYTLPFVYYKNASISRYKEAFKLMREKEKASLFDSLDIALELMKKRYVNPAIIRACKDLDQLDVYLDCLETNELEDFPFFKVKYELYPVKIK